MKKLLLPLLVMLSYFGLYAQSDLKGIFEKNQLTEVPASPSEVLPPPTAEFSWTYNPADSCSPLTVQFMNESTNATSYFWLFWGGSPGTSTAENPTVLYTTPGVYDVNFVAYNTDGSDAIVKSGIIVVLPPVSASFTSNVSVNNASFNNTSTEATSYLWDFGDGDSSTVANPSHTYSSGGDFTVTLIATGDCGADTATQIVSILSAPTADFTADVREGCVPLTVQFSSQASTNATGYAWLFPGGVPSFSSDPNPVVVYPDKMPSTGVGLSVTNAMGSDFEFKPAYIHPMDKPISVIYLYRIDGLSAYVTSQSCCDIDNTLWDFGDGTTSTEIYNIDHIYPQTGTYVVNLTTENECGTSVDTAIFTVIAKPTVDFTFAESGCWPIILDFQNNSINATAYNWTFQGGIPNTSTEQNPTVNYNSSGTYMVILTASNMAGSTVDTQYVDINLYDIPPIVGSVLYSNGLTVGFGYNDTLATSILWEFGDGTTSTEFNPVHTYPYEDYFQVEYAVTNEYCTRTYSLIVHVSPSPTAGYLVINPTTCVTEPVQFINQSSDIATNLQWVFEGGTPSISTEENPMVSFPASGIYMVSIIASNSFGADTFSYPIAIVLEEPIVLGFNVALNGLTASFENTSTNSNSYVWNFGEGTTSTVVNPTYTYPEDGNYFVRLTASNTCGDVVASQWVTIATMPTAGFSADISSGCAPLTVQFFDESSDNAESYLWHFQGGSPSSSTEKNPIVVFNNPGNYAVDLTVSNSAGQSTFTADNLITVNEVPTASFTAFANEAEVTFLNTSVDATTYVWDFGDGETATETNPTHNYSATGDFTVVLAAQNECGSASATQVVNIIGSSSGEISEINSMNIYPNPNNGSFWVELSGQAKPFVHFELINSLGQSIGKKAEGFQAGNLKRLLDFGSLPVGLYSLRVDLGGEAYFSRVVVQ